MSTHAQALARLEGARAQHTKTTADADLIEMALLEHGPEDCAGIHHIQGTAACRFYRAALVALGLKGNKR